MCPLLLVVKVISLKKRSETKMPNSNLSPITYKFSDMLLVQLRKYVHSCLGKVDPEVFEIFGPANENFDGKSTFDRSELVAILKFLCEKPYINRILIRCIVTEIDDISVQDPEQFALLKRIEPLLPVPVVQPVITVAVGPPGPPGPPGPAGATGAQGEHGTQGHTGNTGLTGETGRRGTDGIQGTAGIKGDNGIQGNAGIQGIQGKNSY
jgi:hypothetical protein